ncbi:MAG: alpha/beta hydrolase [Bacteroidota bacterium]|nr:alpha/beta hydrolase [Bacteroidota bacterium]
MQYLSYLKLLFTSLILLSVLSMRAQQQYLRGDTARVDFMMKIVQKHPRIQIPEPPYNYTVEDIKFNDATTGLHYGATLTKPIGKSGFPTVVLLSGTGAQDRDYKVAGHKFFWVLADYLSNHGIGVLRLDDRGTGETNGVYSMCTSLDFAKDALAGVKWLYTRSDIDTSRIGLIGHSEGGILAPMVYKMAPSAVKFMVLVSGPTVGLRVVNSLQTRASRKQFFKQNDTLTNAYMRLHNYVVDRIPQEAHNYNELKKLMNKAADIFYREEDPAIAAKLGVSSGENGGEMLGRYFSTFLNPWWQFILPYDPVKDIRQVKCPVLGIYGDKDQQIPSNECYQLLKSNLPSNRYSKVMMYKDMNHFMQPDTMGNRQDYQEIPVTIKPEVLKGITKWINTLPKSSAI